YYFDNKFISSKYFLHCSFSNDNKGNQFDLSRESPKCLGLLKIVQGIIQNHIACINHVERIQESMDIIFFVKQLHN
ncbi:MAG: hypothetical protein L0K75_11225, partial [Enterococcaceae bacterium]|nr:hypothetical protein [Enterococcaceae bacterium]